MTSPHIFLLTIDCIRADHVGCYGYSVGTTPNLDRLSSEGIRFENCFSTGPRTNESFPGIVSGALSADCDYAGDYWHRVPATPTLASWLDSEGYHTAARLANPQLIDVKHYDFGFDSFRNLGTGNVRPGTNLGQQMDENDSSGSRLKSVKAKLHDLRGNIQETGPISKYAYLPLFITYRELQRRSKWPTTDGQAVADELIQTLALDRSEDSSLFRWAHFNDVHAPINPDRVNRSNHFSSNRIRQYVGDFRRVRQSKSPVYERTYDAMLRYVDERIGEIVSELVRQELWSDSILVVTGDHGEALLDRGIYGHAAGMERYLFDPTRDYMYDELLRVPLIVGGGAVGQRAPVSTPISTAWLHELIAELAGLPDGGFIRGSGEDSLLDMENKRVILADALTQKGHTFAAVHDGYKVITKSLTPDDEAMEDAYVFDLHDDPGEQSHLDVGEAPDEIPAAVEGNVRRVEDLTDVSGGVGVTDDTKELLSQLGYDE